MTAAWLERPEGGSALALRLLVWVALGLGRTITRLVLLPITVYFLLRRRPEREASRAYLNKVLGRPPTLLEIARHFHTFASVTLDRVYFLADRLRLFDTRVSGIPELHRAMDQGCGVLLIGAHVGSFDALRALSLQRPDVEIRVVLDAAHSPILSAILKRLNPTIASSIIDPRKEGTTVALEIGAALQRGALVTMLADRGRPGNPEAAVDFLGSPARFPTAPWQIAAALHTPVVLCVGLFRGGRRYDLHFEQISEGLQLPRRGRQEHVHSLVKRYAERLTHFLRLAPYNWFNFYDFWKEPATDVGHVDAGGDCSRARG